MEMFNNLKDLLNNVNLLGGTSEKVASPLCINEDAGAEILTHFQKQWEELHRNSEENAEKADKAAVLIDQINQKMNNQNSNFIKINQILNASPTLQESVELALQQINELRNSFEDTEKALIEYENFVEKCELEQAKNNHKHQLNLYKEKKLSSLENVRAELAQKHTKTVMDFEQKQKKTLEERQQAFQEAFTNDLETYKTLGTIPKIQVKQQSSALLEEIQLDIDDKDLNDFLDD